MSYELTGSVKVIFDTMTFDSGFTKREFVVTTEDSYPQDVKFETIKDKTSLLESVNEGDRVTVHFDIRGNEYKERYYVNLNAWRITTADQGGDAAGTSAPPPATEEEMGDLPF